VTFLEEEENFDNTNTMQVGTEVNAGDVSSYRMSHEVFFFYIMIFHDRI
jgi:hypothetical protein